MMGTEQQAPAFERWRRVVEQGTPLLKWAPPPTDTRWADLSPRSRWRYAYQAARAGTCPSSLNPHMLADLGRARIALEARVDSEDDRDEHHELAGMREDHEASE